MKSNKNCIYITNINLITNYIKYLYIKNIFKKKNYTTILNQEINNLYDFDKIKYYFYNNNLFYQKQILILKINFSNLNIDKKINFLTNYLNINKKLIIINNNNNYNKNNLNNNIIFLDQIIFKQESLKLLYFFCKNKNIIFNSKIIKIFKILNFNLYKIIKLFNRTNILFFHNIKLKQLFIFIKNNKIKNILYFLNKYKYYIEIYKYLKEKILNLNLIQKKYKNLNQEIIFYKKIEKIINIINKIELLIKIYNKNIEIEILNLIIIILKTQIFRE